MTAALRARWLGRVPYRDALALQRALHGGDARGVGGLPGDARAGGGVSRDARGVGGVPRDDYLLLLEHPHVYTLGRQADTAHLLVPPADVGADLERIDRGGDVTYHGPGQLVGYPIITLPEWRDGLRDVVQYVRRLEAVLIAALADIGVEAGVEKGLTGVWAPTPGGAVDKIAAIGVKVSRGRTMHGFALNVDPDLTMFDHIVPCGIRDRGVTSISRILGHPVEMRTVVDAVVARFAEEFATADALERQDVVWHERRSDLSAFTLQASSANRRSFAADSPEKERQNEGASNRRSSVRQDSTDERQFVEIGRGTGGADAALSGAQAAGPGSAGCGAGAASGPTPVRLLGRRAEAGVTDEVSGRRPEWMRVRARLGEDYRELKNMMRGLDLHTVCEEAGCPNIYECWAERTATFMILGDRCTRACGFCLVDTRRPLPLDPEEPARVAEAVARMGLAHAVITSVARDDTSDGGAAGFAATIAAVRARTPQTTVEVLIPDCRGDADSLQTIFDARPDVLNHNLETVARLQRAARPSAGYARSLSVLGRAKAAGLTTKSGLILGMGEEPSEVRGAIADLRSVGVDILTVGQYLRPSDLHLPVARWWHPDEFAALGSYAESLGFAHVESGPLVRSSYHAKRAVDATDPAPNGEVAAS
ncbi:MAG TPA: lipoyl synthase [Acidimicrobiia bacterium]|nr:lipoyl synthase [Acidimicrobiia bacterium]